MDALDFKILDLLVRNARATWTELSSKLDISIPALTERVRKLEQRGIIKNYSVNVDYQILGFGLEALVFVTLEHPKYRADFDSFIQSTPEVIESLHVTGEDDYMLKVICINTRHLEELVSMKLKGISGVAKTKTIIVLSVTKSEIRDVSKALKKG